MYDFGIAGARSFGGEEYFYGEGEVRLNVMEGCLHESSVAMTCVACAEVA